jgi:hypothetical protein
MQVVNTVISDQSSEWGIRFRLQPPAPAVDHRTYPIGLDVEAVLSML